MIAAEDVPDIANGVDELVNSMLEMPLRRQNRVVTGDALIEEVWGVRRDIERLDIRASSTGISRRTSEA